MDYTEKRLMAVDISISAVGRISHPPFSATLATEADKKSALRRLCRWPARSRIFTQTQKQKSFASFLQKRRPCLAFA
jgi:hypothetical protein